MTRHLDSEEVTQFRSWLAEKKTPLDVWELRQEARKRLRQTPLTLEAVRKALRGVARRGAEVETRGRKRSLSQRAVAALDKKPKELVGRFYRANSSRRHPRNIDMLSMRGRDGG